MHILFDECMPSPFRRHLPGHTVTTVQGMGWSGKKNGDLLALMAGAGLTLLLTVDKNLRYQQNQQDMVAAGVAVVVLYGRGTRLVDILPLVPAVLAALAGPVHPGDVIEVR